MKKLYTIAMAAALTLSASAQTLYFTGAGDGLGWTPETPLEVSLENGAYTVTINNLEQFKVSNAKGSWDEFNAGALEAAGIDNKENLGKPLPLSLSQNNNMVPWKGDYTIVISADLTTLTATTTTPEPEFTGFTKVYLRGAMETSNWGTPEMWEMSTEDGVVYWFDCQGETSIPAGTEFKIADESWGAINYTAGDAVVPFDEPMEWLYNNPTNGVMAVDYTGTIKFDLANGPRQTALVTIYTTIVEHGGAGVADIETADNATKEYFNLQGVRVANPEQGLYIVRQGNKVSKVLVK